MGVRLRSLSLNYLDSKHQQSQSVTYHKKYINIIGKDSIYMELTLALKLPKLNFRAANPTDAALSFVVSLNKLLNKQWSSWWFEIP